MRRYFNLAILTLAFIVSIHSLAFSQKSKKLPLRTLAEIISLNRNGTDQVLAKATLDEQQEYIGIDPMNSMVKLQFVDGLRTISKSHRDLIEWWIKLQHADKKILQLYTYEFLFKENDIEYWIPVQNRDKDTIAAKFRRGDTINLNVLYVGARKAKNESRLDSLFLSTSLEP